MKKKSYGTKAIAKICSVTAPTIIRWIEERKLPSYTTPGGHRRVWDEDLRVFLKANGIRIPEELKTGPSSILIVDDDPTVRKLISRSIQNYLPGFQAVEATDGFEVGQMAEKFKPSLIIVDLVLPGMDGFKVCRQVRELYGDKIKIIAISGHRNSGNEKESLTAGADLFMKKPFDLEDLMKAIRKLLKA